MNKIAKIAVTGAVLLVTEIVGEVLGKATVISALRTANKKYPGGSLQEVVDVFGEDSVKHTELTGHKKLMEKAVYASSKVIDKINEHR